MLDIILNGQASGSVANALMENNFDAGLLRPFIGEDGGSYVTLNKGGKPETMRVSNAGATLRKDEWIMLDRSVQEAARRRLQAVADLRGSGLVYQLANGLGTTVLQSQRMSDVDNAEVSMDALREGERDRPLFDLVSLPLPIVHADFSFSAREIAVSRNGGNPLDTTMAEQSARSVSEEVERLTLGNSTRADQYAFGGGTIYGLTDFPQRITATITTPVGNPTTFGPTLVTEVLNMIKAAAAKFYYGPFKLYYGLDWAPFMESDYSTSKGENTLRDRLMKISQIQDCVQLDYLGTGYQLLLVQQSTNVIRMVIGLDVTTIQWQTHGGLKTHFKVMTIQVPQLRADYNGNTGIVHGTTA